MCRLNKKYDCYSMDILSARTMMKSILSLSMNCRACAGGKTRLEAVQHAKTAIRQYIDELEAAVLYPLPIYTIAISNDYVKRGKPQCLPLCERCLLNNEEEQEQLSYDQC